MVAVRKFSFLSTSLFFSSSFASFFPRSCMTDADANQIAVTWTQLLSNYSTALAQETLTSNFTDYSASASTLNNACPQAPVASPPLEEPLFTNRTQFEGGQGAAPPLGSKIYKIWHTCSTVIMRWKLTNTTDGGRPVIGLIAFETVPAPTGNQYPYLISMTYSEFDVGAWIANLVDAGQCKNSSTAEY